MTSHRQEPNYALGSSQEELERLQRQARLIGPFTENVFRAAGIKKGAHVLDFGSGAGDVSIMLADLVGPTGSVTGIDRNAASVEKATSRVGAMGLKNVNFVAGDVRDVAVEGQFDAVVGRLVLLYVPKPETALQALLPKLKPGAVAAFVECTPIPPYLVEDLPLFRACNDKLVEIYEACDADLQMGQKLHHTFTAAGLPAPEMIMETLLGRSDDLVRTRADIFRSLEPQAKARGVTYDSIGSLDTLTARLRAELDATPAVVPWLIGLVGAWAQLP
jgi:SAM-dependent methyltransferase